VEAERDAVGEVDRNDGLQGGRVQDDQVATAGGSVVDESHQHPVVFDGVRCGRDEDELADAFVRAEPPSGGQAAAQIVPEYRVAGIAPGSRRRHGVAVPALVTDEPVVAGTPAGGRLAAFADLAVGEVDRPPIEGSRARHPTTPQPAG
jgi:hypothetical protein